MDTQLSLEIGTLVLGAAFLAWLAFQVVTWLRQAINLGLWILRRVVAPMIAALVVGFLVQAALPTPHTLAGEVTSLAGGVMATLVSLAMGVKKA